LATVSETKYEKGQISATACKKEGRVFWIKKGRDEFGSPPS